MRERPPLLLRARGRGRRLFDDRRTAVLVREARLAGGGVVELDGVARAFDQFAADIRADGLRIREEMREGGEKLFCCVVFHVRMFPLLRFSELHDTIEILDGDRANRSLCATRHLARIIENASLGVVAA